MQFVDCAIEIIIEATFELLMAKTCHTQIIIQSILSICIQASSDLFFL